MVTTLIERENSIQDILGKSNLRLDAQESILRRTAGEFSSLRGALAEIMTLNPVFHFTTDRFNFHPAGPEDHQTFLKKSRLYRWRVRDRGADGFYVETGNSTNIMNNGLRANSCVAVMPPGENTELMRAHPRLFFDALIFTFVKFGKHTVPYKNSPLQKASGLLTDIEAAVVIMPDSIPLYPKGVEQRQGLSASNLLRARTNLTYRCVQPDEILAVVRFPIRQDITCVRGSSVSGNCLALSNDILRGFVQEGENLLTALREKVIATDTAKMQRMIDIFNGICGRK